jgi:Uma2 family endonuclease
MDMYIQIPLVNSMVLDDPPLTDEEFERLSERTEGVKLERAKDGRIIVNPPTGMDSGKGNSEINHQLRVWWKGHRRGWVFDSSAGFFLPDGSSKSPDAAYATEEQVRGLSREERKHFGYFRPAFVIELLSAPDRLPEAKAKMEKWLANGAQLGWLIDPYQRNVWAYEPGQKPLLETGNQVVGSGPVAGFVLELSDVWSEFE